MPLISAKTMNRPARSQQLIAFVVFPGVKLLDLAGPLQVFADAPRATGGRPSYRTLVASLDGGAVATDTGVELPTVSLASVVRKAIDTLVVAGGSGVHEAARDEVLVGSVARLERRARRTASICSGAFILAAAGLLDGKRAVTHWEFCGQLAREHPLVQVESDPIFIKQGSIWTSAGVTAGIDLALAMVAEDLGRPAALDVARSLVSYMVRPGGQSQFSSALSSQLADASGRFDALHHWISQNLDRDLRVETLADRMHMTARTFARTYAEQTGRTPAKAVETMRVEAARDLLEGGKLSIAAIAQRCGFGDDERMRCAFQRSLHVSPSDYRQRFRR